MPADTVIRNQSGKFEKGNKCGGRKPIPPEIKEALTELVPKAIERLSAIINDSEDDKLVMDAVKVILDRVYGKPQQALDIESVNKTDNTVTIKLEGELAKWSR